MTKLKDEKNTEKCSRKTTKRTKRLTLWPPRSKDPTGRLRDSNAVRLGDPEMLPKGYRDNRKHDAKTLRTRYTIDQDRRTIEPTLQPHRAQASVPNSCPLTPSKPRTPATPFAGIRRHPIYGCEDVRFERIERLKRIEPRRKTTDPSREGRSPRRSGRSFFRTIRFRLLRTCRFGFSVNRLDSDR